MLSASDSTHTDRLLERVRQGDESARAELLNLHRNYLRRLIDLRMDSDLRRRLDPSDIVQETQLESTRRLDEYLQRQPMSFRLWLRQNAIEQVANMYRRHVQTGKRNIRREVPFSRLSSMGVARFLLGDQPGERLRVQEIAEQVQQALGELSDADREILLLRHSEELTNAEVAELLQIAPNAASKRYGRALRRLHRQLTAADPHFGDSVRGLK